MDAALARPVLCGPELLCPILRHPAALQNGGRNGGGGARLPPRLQVGAGAAAPVRRFSLLALRALKAPLLSHATACPDARMPSFLEACPGLPPPPPPPLCTLRTQPACLAPARSPHDKLAWAVHAFLLAEGFKLVATGAAAEDEITGGLGGLARLATPRQACPPAARLCRLCIRCTLACRAAAGAPQRGHAPPRFADFLASREEVAPTGWDALPGAYAFRYQDTEGGATEPGTTAQKAGGACVCACLTPRHGRLACRAEISVAAAWPAVLRARPHTLLNCSLLAGPLPCL